MQKSCVIFCLIVGFLSAFPAGAQRGRNSMHEMHRQIESRSQTQKPKSIEDQIREIRQLSSEDQSKAADNLFAYDLQLIEYKLLGSDRFFGRIQDAFAGVNIANRSRQIASAKSSLKILRKSNFDLTIINALADACDPATNKSTYSSKDVIGALLRLGDMNLTDQNKIVDEMIGAAGKVIYPSFDSEQAGRWKNLQKYWDKTSLQFDTGKGKLFTGYAADMQSAIAEALVTNVAKLETVNFPSNSSVEFLFSQGNNNLRGKDLIKQKIGNDQPKATPTEIIGSLANEPTTVTEVSQAASSDSISKNLLSVVINTDKVDQIKRISIPQWEFFNLEKRIVQNRFHEAFLSVPVGEKILFTSLPVGMATSDLLPGRLTARTFDSSARFAVSHLRNLDILFNIQIDPKKTIFFNFVAPEPGISVGATGKKKWSLLSKKYDDIGNSLGLENRKKKSELFDALNDGSADVIVVVAHGDNKTVYLPNGERVTIDEIIRLKALKIERPPIVVLLACNTGRATDGVLTSMAQALLNSGRATAVLAPTRRVSAGKSTAEILRRLVEAGSTGNLPVFMRSLKGPWQFYVEVAPARDELSGEPAS